MKKPISTSRLAVTLAAVLLFPTASFGESPSSESSKSEPSKSEPSKSESSKSESSKSGSPRQQMIQKVLDLQHFNELFDEHVGIGFNAESSIIRARFKDNKSIPEADKAKLLELFERFPKLLKEKLDTTAMARAAVVDFFEKTFNDEDLKVMADFYEKPAGQKECTSITKLTTSLVENSTTNLAPRFRRAAMQAYEEAMSKGLVPKPAPAAPTPQDSPNKSNDG